MIRFFILISLGLFLFGALRRPVVAQSKEGSVPPLLARPNRSAKSAQTPPIRFRRIYAPLEFIKKWPQKLNPMDREKFESLIKQIDNDIERLHTTSVMIQKSEYRARLAKDTLISDTSELSIIHRATGPALLPLTPCGLAITSPRWKSDESSPVKWGHPPGGPLSVLVEKSDQLLFSWSLLGKRDQQGGLNFVINLPSGIHTRFVLELSDKLSPIVSGGIISNVASVASKPNEGGENVTPKMNRWTILLRGGSILKINIMPRSGSVTRRLVRARQATSYEMTTKGLSVSMDLILGIHHEPLEKMTLAIDRDLTLLDVRYGDLKIDTHTLKTQPNEPRQIELRFATPLQGDDRILHIRAIGSAEFGSRFALPRIRPIGLFWEGGSANLRVHQPLELLLLKTNECQQASPIRVETIDMVDDLPKSETVDFNLFHPDATIELIVDRLNEGLKVASVTAVEIEATESSGRVSFEVSTSTGHRTKIEATVHPGWVVESVHEALANGDGVDDARDLPFEQFGPKLTIECGVIQRGSPRRITVTGRRRGNFVNRTYTVSDFVMLHFDTTLSVRELISLRARDPFRLEIRGDHPANPLSPADLNATERLLLADARETLLLVRDENSESLGLALTTVRPSYRAELRCDVTFQQKSVRQTYTIQCTPEEGRLQQIEVQFSALSDSPVRWMVPAQGEAEFTAVRSPSARSGKEGTESWLITFKVPRGQTVELKAEREFDFVGSSPVSLPRLPDAASQKGLVVFHAPEGRLPKIVNHRRLRNFMIVTDRVDQQHDILAAFRYDPLRDADPTTEPALSIHRDESSSPVDRVWALSAAMRSRFQPNGDQRHLVSYEIENTGQRAVTFEMPERVQESDVWLDDVLQGAQIVTDGQIEIALPFGQRFVSIRLDYRRTSSPFHSFGTIGPDWPSPNMKVLTNRWTFSLPPHYELINLQHARMTATMPAKSWSQRLFGPLGRQRTASPDSAESPSLSEETEEGSDADNDADNIEEKNDAVSFSNEPASQWRVFQSTSSGNETARIVVLHRDLVLTLSVAIFFAVLILGVWKLVNRFALVVALWCGSGLAALLIPDRFVAVIPVFTAIHMALIATIGARVLAAAGSSRIGAAWRGTEPSHSSISMATARIGVLLVIGFAIACAAVTLAAKEQSVDKLVAGNGGDPPRKSPKLNGTPFPVFLPIDENNKPVGDKVFVAETFYRHLLTASANTNGQAPGSLVESVSYRAELQWNRTRDHLQIPYLTATFNVTVFDADREIFIESQVQPERAKLNGMLLDFENQRWDFDARQFRFRVPRPGRYQLELKFKQEATTLDTMREGVVFSVPPMAMARLTLTVPHDAPKIEVGDALGRIEKRAGQIVADLGPSETLTISWLKNVMPGDGVIQFDTEELLWLRVKHGSVMLNARIRVKVEQGRLSELRISADPRLGLLPFRTDSPVASWERSADNPATIVLHLSRPLMKQDTIDIQFLLRDGTGVGNVQLPSFSVLGARLRRRYFAVSLDPNLDFKVTGKSNENNGNVKNIDAADFLNRWADPQQKAPALSYVQSGDETDWTLTTRPASEQIVVDELLRVVHDRRLVRLNYHAVVNVKSDNVLRYQIHIPQNLKVNRVKVISDGSTGTPASQILRIGRSTPVVTQMGEQPRTTVLTVFLKSRAEGQQTIIVDGEMPFVAKQPIATPLIHIENTTVNSSRMKVYRQFDTGVEISPEDAAKVAGESSHSEPWHMRLLREVVGDGQPIVTTIVFPDDSPRIDGKLTTRITQNNGDWLVETVFEVNVTSGMADVFRVDVPDDWSDRGVSVTDDREHGPPEFFFRKQSSQRLRRVLAIKPRQPVNGPYRFTVSYRVNYLSDTQRFGLPSLRAAPSARHIVILPKKWETGPIHWRTPGMTKTNDRPAEAKSASPRYHFEVTDPNSEIIYEAPIQPASIPRIHLVDVVVFPNGPTDFSAAASYDIEPAGLHDCMLTLDENISLIHVRIDGQPAALERRDDDTWHFSLGGRIFPCRLEVLYQVTDRPVIGSKTNLTAPVISTESGPLPVERTLWTVQDLSSGARMELVDDKSVQRIDPIRQELFRLKNIADIVQSTPIQPGDDQVQPHRLWARRFLNNYQSFYRLRKLEQLSDTSEAATEAGIAIEKLFQAPRRYLIGRVSDENRMDGLTTIARRAAASFRHKYELSRPDVKRVGATSESEPRDVARSAILLSAGKNWLVFEVFADQADAFFEEIESHFGPEPVAWTMADQPLIPETSEAAWQSSMSQLGSRTHYMSRGPVFSIPMKISKPSTGGGARWLAALLLCVGATGIIFLQQRKIQITDFLVQWPQMFIVAGGLFWLLFLTPPWIGLVILGFAVYCSLHSGWRKPRLLRTRS